MKLNLSKLKNLKFSFSAYYKTILTLFVLLFFIFLNAHWLEVKYFLNGFNQIFSSDMQIYSLDVGQALSTLIITPDKQAIVVDTGEGDTNLVEKIDYILSKNDIKDISMLILTHPDADHVGGTVDLLKNFQVNNIFRPKVYASFEVDEDNYKYSTTYTYQNAIQSIIDEPNSRMFFVDDLSLKFGDLSFEVYAPKLDRYSDSNSYSPYILLSYKTQKFLLS